MALIATFCMKVNRNWTSVEQLESKFTVLEVHNNL